MAVTVMLLNVAVAFDQIDFSHTASCPTCDSVHGLSLAPATPLIIIFSAFMVLSAFSFLNTRKGSDFYHSIPASRICVYNSFVAAICTWIFVVTFVTVFINWFLYFITPSHFTNIFQALLIAIGCMLCSLALAGAVTFCRMLSGTNIATVFYTVCLLTVPRASLYLFKEFLTFFNPSIYPEKTFFKYLSVEYSLFFPLKNFTQIDRYIRSFENIYLLLFLLAEAVILFGAGAYFYKRRNSEAAGKTPASKSTQNLFRTLISFPVIVYAVSLLTKANYSVILIPIIAFSSLILHFLFELCTTKNVKKTLKSLPMIFVSVILSACLIGTSFLTASAYKASDPTAEKLESIEIIDLYKINPDENSISTLNIKITAEEGKELILNRLRLSTAPSKKSLSHILHVKFKLKNGNEKFRVINFDNSKEDLKAFNEMYDHIKIYDNRKKLIEEIPQGAQSCQLEFYYFSHKISKNSQHNEKLVNAFREEYKMLSEKEKRSSAFTKNSSGKYIASILLTWNNEFFRFYLSPEQMPKSLLHAFTEGSALTENKLPNQFSQCVDSALYNSKFANNQLEVKSISDPSIHFSLTYRELNQINISLGENIQDIEKNREAFLKFRASISSKGLTDYSNIEEIYAVTSPFSDSKYKFFFLHFTDEQINFLSEKGHNN